LKENEPEVYARTYKFLTGSSFITAKLTGAYWVDKFLGLASFNPLYDSDGMPDAELLQARLQDPISSPGLERRPTSRATSPRRPLVKRDSPKVRRW